MTLNLKDSVIEPFIVEKNEFITMVILYARMNRPIDRHSSNHSTLNSSNCFRHKLLYDLMAKYLEVQEYFFAY